MSTTQPTGVSGWARFLGVSLRPWSGHAPASLLLRGVIQTGVGVALVVAWVKMSADAAGSTGLDSPTAAILRPIMIIAVITVGYLLASGVAQLIVGILDLTARLTVSGYVISNSERRFGDFLPRFLERQIFSRLNNGGGDNRKLRWEIVVDTGSGHKALTVRKRKIRDQIPTGAYVSLRVTPIAGYVESATVSGPPQQ